MCVCVCVCVCVCKSLGLNLPNKDFRYFAVWMFAHLERKIIVGNAFTLLRVNIGHHSKFNKTAKGCM